jgi:hypothetical protein
MRAIVRLRGGNYDDGLWDLAHNTPDIFNNTDACAEMPSVIEVFGARNNGEPQFSKDHGKRGFANRGYTTLLKATLPKKKKKASSSGNLIFDLFIVSDPDSQSELSFNFGNFPKVILQLSLF